MKKNINKKIGIPQGVFFAFGGTSIDKKDRSTYRVFGKLLDRYSPSKSNATLRHKVVNNESVIHIKSSNSYSYCFDFSK
jgi:type I site-specific restriction-modification system R (restriction) subunit